MKKVFLSVVLVFALAATTVSCKDTKKTEEATEAVEETVEEAGNAIEAAADDAAEVIDSAAAAVEEAVDSIAQ